MDQLFVQYDVYIKLYKRLLVQFSTIKSQTAFTSSSQGKSQNEDSELHSNIIIIRIISKTRIAAC